MRAFHLGDVASYDYARSVQGRALTNISDTELDFVFRDSSANSDLGTQTKAFAGAV